jgi:alpha-tubulin suppressor-like RCC1 family protein
MIAGVLKSVDRTVKFRRHARTRLLVAFVGVLAAMGHSHSRADEMQELQILARISAVGLPQNPEEGCPLAPEVGAPCAISVSYSDGGSAACVVSMVCRLKGKLETIFLPMVARSPMSCRMDASKGRVWVSNSTIDPVKGRKTFNSIELSTEDFTVTADGREVHSGIWETTCDTAEFQLDAVRAQHGSLSRLFESSSTIRTNDRKPPTVTAQDDQPQSPPTATDADGRTRDCRFDAVFSGPGNSCGKRHDGTLWCWGRDFPLDQQSRVAQRIFPDRITQVAVGLQTCVLSTSSHLRCWGQNLSGQVGNGRTGSSVFPPADFPWPWQWKSVSVNIDQTCGVRSDSTVHCWGSNSDGRLGDNKQAAISTAPVQMLALGKGAADVAVGAHHTCALKLDGTVWCWGWNKAGQLGDGSHKSHTAANPVQVRGLKQIVQLSAGSFHTCARTGAGALFCWGQNSEGQLGDGTRVSRSTPVPVKGLGAGISSVSADDQTCVVKTDGTVWCWGPNHDGDSEMDRTGEFGNTVALAPVQISSLGHNVTQVSVGFRHTCARKSDGRAFCWGQNAQGELGDGKTTMRVTPAAVLCNDTLSSN